MICSIDGCEKKVYRRQWCVKHYRRWERNGDPNIVKIKYHGYWGHLFYTVWQDMKSRCYNENNNRYEDYGGRGIIVCDEWMNPKVFIEWCLNNGWEKGLQIDRIDNDRNYSPENCQFLTHVENQHNVRLLRKNNTSGFRGVCHHQKKWKSEITINNKKIHLGCFNTPEEAAIVYDRAVPDNRPRNFS